MPAPTASPHPSYDTHRIAHSLAGAGVSSTPPKHLCPCRCTRQASRHTDPTTAPSSTGQLPSGVRRAAAAAAVRAGPTAGVWRRPTAGVWRRATSRLRRRPTARLRRAAIGLRNATGALVPLPQPSEAHKRHERVTSPSIVFFPPSIDTLSPPHTLTKCGFRLWALSYPLRRVFFFSGGATVGGIDLSVCPLGPLRAPRTSPSCWVD